MLPITIRMANAPNFHVYCVRHFVYCDSFAGAVMAILFVITGWLIIGIGYQVGKIYRKYCGDIISIVEFITSTAIAIYFGDWIKSIISINLITWLLLVHVVYIGIRCYVKDWLEERGYY